MIVYISAPYTKGDVCENVRRACLAGDELLKKGHIPFIPHLAHLWHLISPHPWETWIQIDIALLERCDAILRLDSDSKGADLEVKRAKELGIPIYYNIGDVPSKWVDWTAWVVP